VEALLNLLLLLFTLLFILINLDHCHLLISINPKAQISAFASNLKTVSSRRIRKEFPKQCARFYRKPVFWKIGYFVSSTGGANLETVKKYIHKLDAPTR
jgi:putative transposase